MSTMMRFREIVAKYDSTCGTCGKSVAKRDGVWWKKGERVRCEECTPYEERALWSDLASRSRFAEEDKAHRRKTLYIKVFPFIREDKDRAATPLLEQLARTEEPAEIHTLIDQINAVTEPAKPLRVRKAQAP